MDEGERAMLNVDDAMAKISKPWAAHTREGRVVSCDTADDAQRVLAEMERAEQLEDKVAELQAEREALQVELKGLHRRAEVLQTQVDNRNELAAEWRDKAEAWRYRYMQTVVILAEMAQDYEL
jgi:predicted  nucleic acid-binding Zn-ribbon protein